MEGLGDEWCELRKLNRITFAVLVRWLHLNIVTKTPKIGVHPRDALYICIAA